MNGHASNMAVVRTRRDPLCLFKGRAAARGTPPRLGSSVKRWGYLRIAAMLSAVHLALVLGCLIVSFSIGLRRWDLGSAGFVESFANGLGAVLLQPGAQLLTMGMPGSLVWEIIVGNRVVCVALGSIVVRP